MRVVVSENDNMELSFDKVVISPAEFNHPKYHLFIISNDFDEVVVELTDKINLGTLRPLQSRTKVVPKIVGDINLHVIGLLCELYPEKAAELRYTSVRNPESVPNVVDKMMEEYGWKNFYD